jgi:DNA-directed RNA polymerase subunit RPC12/RpoP
VDDRKTARYLQALRVVRKAGGTLEPTWDPLSSDGVTYRGTGSALDDSGLGNDLEELANDAYLERVFVDRLSRCPHCSSHALNVREVCLTCGSANLTQMKTILHFRCGYVGPITSFKEEAKGRRCPKCGKIFDNLGTDHDSPGEYFICRACNADFQFPEVGARCVSCGSVFRGVDMANVRSSDVYAYRMTALGAAALEDGRIRD